MIRRVGLPLAWLLLVAAGVLQAEDGPLTLVDLPALRDAVRSVPKEPARAVTFRQLWDDPGGYKGRHVAVQGEVRRLFHQDAAGELPALVETWISTPQGDTLCLVSPEARPELGSLVRFSGTYLKRIEYRAGDVPRLAPLIIGPEPPEEVSPSKAARLLARRPRWLDWSIGLGLGLVVLMALARARARRPPPSRLDRDPDPVFLDGEADDRRRSDDGEGPGDASPRV